MQRIALNFLSVDPESRLSGIGNYCVKLLEHMLAIAQENHLRIAFDVYAQTGAEAHFPEPLRKHIISLPRIANRFHRVIFEQTRFALQLRRRGTDLLFNPAFTGPLWGARRNVTVVHDLYFRTVPELLDPLQRRYLQALVPMNCRRSWKVITDSRSGAQDLIRFYPELSDRIAAIPLAGRFDPGPPVGGRPAILPSGPYVLMVASLTGNKNPATAVAALARLRAAGHDLQLVHVGADPQRLLERAIAQFRAENWVIKLRGIDDATLVGVYRHAHCLAVPSIYEGFGLPVLEGQQLGVPVVASNASCLPEVGGDGALYFDPLDEAALAEHIATLLADPALRAGKIEKGLRNARSYSWRRTAEETMAVLQLLPPETTQ